MHKTKIKPFKQNLIEYKIHAVYPIILWWPSLQCPLQWFLCGLRYGPILALHTFVGCRPSLPRHRRVEDLSGIRGMPIWAVSSPFMHAAAYPLVIAEATLYIRVSSSIAITVFLMYGKKSHHQFTSGKIVGKLLNL